MSGVRGAAGVRGGGEDGRGGGLAAVWLASGGEALPEDCSGRGSVLVEAGSTRSTGANAVLRRQGLKYAGLAM